MKRHQKNSKMLKKLFRRKLCKRYIQILFHKKFFCKFALWTTDGAHHQKKIKTDEWGINVLISWTQRIRNISIKQNLCPHQNIITFSGLLWDTLYEYIFQHLKKLLAYIHSAEWWKIRLPFSSKKALFMPSFNATLMKNCWLMGAVRWDYIIPRSNLKKKL